MKQVSIECERTFGNVCLCYLSRSAGSRKLVWNYLSFFFRGSGRAAGFSVLPVHLCGLVAFGYDTPVVVCLSKFSAGTGDVVMMLIASRVSEFLTIPTMLWIGVAVSSGLCNGLFSKCIRAGVEQRSYAPISVRNVSKTGAHREAVEERKIKMWLKPAVFIVRMLSFVRETQLTLLPSRARRL